MIFDGVTIGSPVTTNQINELVGYCLDVRDKCPCVASFTYLGPQGVTVSDIKETTEFTTAIAVPVPTVVSSANETLHVLPSPLTYLGSEQISLTQGVLGWEFRARYSRTSVGTFLSQGLPTPWCAYSAQDWLGTMANEVSFDLTIGSPSYSYFCGAFVSVRLTGNLGYGGNLPHFTAFFTV